MAELRWQRLPDGPGHWLWVKWERGELFSGIWEVAQATGSLERGVRATAWAKIDLPSTDFLEGENHGD